MQLTFFLSHYETKNNKYSKFPTSEIDFKSALSQMNCIVPVEQKSLQGDVEKCTPGMVVNAFNLSV